MCTCYDTLRTNGRLTCLGSNMERGEKWLGTKVFSFGPYRLTPGRRLLEKDGVPIIVGGRALDILILLIERPQEVVTKRELFERVWPKLNVDDSSLRGHISGLRKALGEGQADERYVANVPGRGYCFVSPVSTTPELEGKKDFADKGSRKLPPHATRVIGREEAIDKITAQLVGQRFVSIVGPGGIGKTTVALSVGHCLAESFADEVYFVDFGALTDPSLVPSALALTFGVMVTSGDPVPSLLSALRDRRVLVLLDGCEHVAEAIAALAESVFRNSPNVFILTTSRESLRADGERVYRLGPLSCPPDDPTMTSGELLSFPAAQLFIERLSTRGISSDFNHADAPAVGEICRRLDGIALALELAAGRVDGYGIQGIASLLGSELSLHLPGRRTAIPRQRTLSATIEWSYNLLSEAQRRVLRRLSVFVGTFSIDAAQLVAQAGDTSVHDIVEAIAALVSKSLMTANVTDTGLRYRLLDTTRTYLLPLLSLAGEADDVAHRHALYHCMRLDRSEVGAPSVSDPGAGRDESVANVRMALEWSFSTRGDLEVAVRLAAAAASLFLEMSLLTECRDWTEKAVLAIDTGAAPTRHAMELWISLALSRMFTEGNSDAAHSAFDKALALSESLPDLGFQLRILSGLHLFLARIGNFQEALSRAKLSLSVAERLGDDRSISLATAMLGTAYHLAGDQAAAEVHCGLAYRRPPAARDLSLLQYGYDHRTRALGALARVYWLRGKPGKAVEVARETIGLGKTLDHPVSFCIAHMFSASIFFWVGDLVAAEEVVQNVRAHAEKHSLTPYSAVAAGMAGKLLIGSGERSAGMYRLRQCLDQLRAGRHRILAIPFMTELAENLSIIGDHDEALAVIGSVISQDEESGGSWYTPEMLRVKGAVLGAMLGQHLIEAEECIAESLDWSRRQSSPAWELRAAMTLAALRKGHSHHEEVGTLLRRVYGQFEDGHETPDLVAARHLLQGKVRPAGNV
jgi:predicted ATPase/DNA-binding winged helix-turn-helix (wHTH) protein